MLELGFFAQRSLKMSQKFVVLRPGSEHVFTSKNMLHMLGESSNLSRATNKP
jgi:hypothetical protein